MPSKAVERIPAGEFRLRFRGGWAAAIAHLSR